MKIQTKVILLAVAASIGVGATGCATRLTEEATKVRVVTDRTGCEFIKMITARRTLGQDKQGNALMEALNIVAAEGGNALYVVVSGIHWADGASVSGEALRCPEGKFK